MANRRVFHTDFPGAKGQMPSRENQGGPKWNPDTPDPNKKPAPLEITHAENFYWLKQMQARTPMAIVLEDGETLRGIVEWYDRDCIKLTRRGSPNLMIFKRVTKYVYKDSEENR